MTYYEEFGLSPGASTEQIRHCYKALAKLLHPDQISDDNLKGLAELQMRRLNQILAVLTDPEKRRHYDAGLEDRLEPIRRRGGSRTIPSHVHRPPRRLLIALCAWGLPLAALVIFMMILLSEGAGARSVPIAPPVADASSEVTPSDAPAPAETQPRFNPPAPPVEDRAGRDQLLTRLRTAETQLDKLRAEHQRTLEELALAARPVSRVEVLASPIPRFMPRRIMDAKQATPAGQPEAGFSGHWYYVPVERDRASNGMYTPEYIELHISENSGVVRGRYQARYRVTDQAIEPEVDFRFEGGGSAPDAQFPWAGPGASQGKVTLRLISADRLEVTWSATQLSAELNLASGIAQLIRQREP